MTIQLILIGVIFLTPLLARSELVEVRVGDVMISIPVPEGFVTELGDLRKSTMLTLPWPTCVSKVCPAAAPWVWALEATAKIRPQMMNNRDAIMKKSVVILVNIFSDVFTGIAGLFFVGLSSFFLHKTWCFVVDRFFGSGGVQPLGGSLPVART
jgi:hypothetical protein